MNPERWKQIKEILDQVSEASPSSRQQILEDLKQRDSELLTDVESYLPYEKTDCFIDLPVWDLLPEDATDLNPVGPLGRQNGNRDPETRIGPYRLLSLLGKGGMGQVHLAVREDDYEQKVAIKRTLGALVHQELRARFTNERQILANLQHPGIARLLDGGTDDQGLPYLVMEYVEGEPITQYCENHGLTLRQRLRLFRKVCQAVHFAHQNLIVHRDLKPGNILVTDDGKPRLLDFGIAKLLESSRDDQVTAEGKVPLTPACASPEQLMGDPITTATDIYALGLLLYELLAGRRAYNFDDVGLGAMIRQVCLREPPKPSQAVGTNPANDGEPPTESTWHGRIPKPPAEEDPREDRFIRRRRRQLQGDLDAIVMKAIRKEPAHRYLSAADLADDVLSYLEGRPVEARRGNWLYHTGKFLIRNRPAFAVLLLIVASTVTSTAMWQRAETMRQRAETMRQRAETIRFKAEDREQEAIAARDHAGALSDFLNNLLTSADPDKSRGEALTVKELIENGEDSIETELDGRPEIQAEMYNTFGQIFSALDADTESLVMQKRALEKFRLASPRASQDLALYIANLGGAHYEVENFKAAEQQYLQSIRMQHSLGIPEREYIKTIRNLASIQLKLGKLEDAESGYLKVVSILSEDPETAQGELGFAHHSLGTFYRNIGYFDPAVAHLEKALDHYRQTSDTLSTQVGSTYSALGESYSEMGHLDSAFEQLEPALGIFLQRVPNSKKEATCRRRLAVAHLRSGALDRAQSELDRSTGILSRHHSEDHWLIAAYGAVQGAIWAQSGETGRAEQQLLRSLEILRAREIPAYDHLRFTWEALIHLYESENDQEAARIQRAALNAALAGSAYRDSAK